MQQRYDDMSKRQFSGAARRLKVGRVGSATSSSRDSPLSSSLMHPSTTTCRVIDLAEYRAKRARARTVRYVLWYPGFGFFAPNVLASAPATAAAACDFRGVGRGERRPY